MSKTKILNAAKRKGITFDEIYFDRQVVTPEEIVSAWVIALSDQSQAAIADADPEFTDYTPDVWNTPMVLEWIDSLPDIRSIAPKPEGGHG